MVFAFKYRWNCLCLVVVRWLFEQLDSSGWFTFCLDGCGSCSWSRMSLILSGCSSCSWSWISLLLGLGDIARWVCKVFVMVQEIVSVGVCIVFPFWIV